MDGSALIDRKTKLFIMKYMEGSECRLFLVSSHFIEIILIDSSAVF